MLKQLIKKLISALKTFAFGDEVESDKGYIHIVTPELEVKAKFDDEESMLRIQTIINNEISLRFNRMEELE